MDSSAYRLLTLRCSTPLRRWPTADDERFAERLARALEPLLAEEGVGEVNGFELAAGTIDILIYGRDSARDQGHARAVVESLLEVFACPTGMQVTCLEPPPRG